jgi:SWI/SNF-related matrix-associated actin-dependent regulator of chromatin subfamily A3
MRRQDRTISMERFKKDPKVTVMLISLKAGGVGLNLTSASRIYLMEPYWNPAVEQQAIDRVHRLGQTRTVHTIRFIAKNTIEENIVELQKKKMKLAKLTFNEEEGSSRKKSKEAMQKERIADLRNLFK